MITFDLEKRTFRFAENVKEFLKKVPQTPINREYIKQLVRSSASIGANYLEANDALGDADFTYRLKISRKESKETCLWLKLIDIDPSRTLENERQVLLKEATEFRLIFSKMISNKSQ
jgi:four helix bundle protein